VVKIRLSRTGVANRPYNRIVAVDSRKKRDGECLETLGSYDPLKHQILQINREGIQNWVAKGAQMTDAVVKIMKMAAKATNS
jgi:small subunit ribosomal protein S16